MLAIVMEGSSPHHQRAKLTDVGALNAGLRCPEAQSDILEPSSSTLASARTLSSLRFRVDEDVRLLLKGALGLNRQLGCHDC